MFFSQFKSRYPYPMLIVTTPDIPGYRIDAVLGEVMGMTVRSANMGANFVASFKSIGGGEISEYTNLVYDSRNQVMQRMWEQCVQRGGNAIVGMRFDTGDIAQAFSEVCAYGTAVVVQPIASAEDGGTPQSIADAQAKSGQAAATPAPAYAATPQAYGGAPAQPGQAQPGQAQPGQAQPYGQPTGSQAYPAPSGPQPPAGYGAPAHR